MKRIILVIAFAIYSLVIMAQGPDIKLPKTFENSSFKLITNRTTMNYPRIKVKIAVWIDNDAPNGIAARFKSNMPVSFLETAGSGQTTTKNVTNYQPHTYEGLIYLNAPTYYNADTYILSFYMAGKPKAVWKSAIQRKK